MNASEKVALLALIRRIRDQFSLAILVIEHDMRLVMGVWSGSWCSTTA